MSFLFFARKLNLQRSQKCSIGLSNAALLLQIQRKANCSS